MSIPTISHWREWSDSAFAFEIATLNTREQALVRNHVAHFDHRHVFGADDVPFCVVFTLDIENFPLENIYMHSNVRVPCISEACKYMREEMKLCLTINNQ